MKKKVIEKVLKELLWGLNTARDQLEFGQGPVQGAKSRERRYRGIFLTSINQLESLLPDGDNEPEEESEAEKFCSFTNEVVMLKIKANELGLNMTCKSLDSATSMVGWEVAEILKRKNKDG